MFIAFVLQVRVIRFVSQAICRLHGIQHASGICKPAHVMRSPIQPSMCAGGCECELVCVCVCLLAKRKLDISKVRNHIQIIVANLKLMIRITAFSSQHTAFSRLSNRLLRFAFIAQLLWKYTPKYIYMHCMQLANQYRVGSEVWVGVRGNEGERKRDISLTQLRVFGIFGGARLTHDFSRFGCVICLLRAMPGVDVFGRVCVCVSEQM